MVPPGLTEDEYYNLKVEISEMTAKQLERLAAAVSISRKKRLARAQFTSKANALKVFKYLQSVKDAFEELNLNPEVRVFNQYTKKVVESKIMASSGKLPLKEMRERRRRKQATKAQPQRPSEPVLEQSEKLDFNVPLFDVRHTDEKDRTPMSELSPGQSCLGVVTGFSLFDGLKVDIGASVDALIPVNFEKQPASLQFALAFTGLGEQVEVILSEVCEEQYAASRRFPVVATLKSPAWPEGLGLIEEDSSHKALMFKAGEDSVQVLAARCLDETEDSPGEKAVKELSGRHSRSSEYGPEDEQHLMPFKELPARSPPEEILSPDLQGNVSRVSVPEEHRASDAAKQEVNPELREAWEALATKEQDLIAAEARCKQRFAKELDTFQRYIEAGRRPPLPLSLLGLTVLDCGKRCMLPTIRTDIVTFYFHDFESHAHLESWVAGQRHKHMTSNFTEEALAKNREALIELLNVKDVVHILGLQAVQAEVLASIHHEKAAEVEDGVAELEAAVRKMAEAHPQMVVQKPAVQEDLMATPV